MRRYRSLFEDKFENYDPDYLKNCVKYITSLFGQAVKVSNSIRTTHGLIGTRVPKDLLQEVLNTAKKYSDLFPSFQVVGFNIKYSKESQLTQFLESFDKFIATEAGAFYNSLLARKGIQAIIKKFRPYESILNNIHLAFKNKDINEFTPEQLEKIFERIGTQANNGVGLLQSILKSIIGLEEFMIEHQKEMEFFTNDTEENYKGINIGIRVPDKIHMPEAEHSKDLIKEFLDFAYSFGFKNHIKSFKKVIISSRDYYPKITGGMPDDTIAFFMRKLNVIFIPYDYVPGEGEYNLSWAIYHEFGHYFHGIAKKELGGVIFDLWDANYNKYKKVPNYLPTQYAYTNKQEAFAEMFAWYFCDKSLRVPGKIQPIKDKVIDLFEEILKRLNIKLNPGARK